VATLVLPSNSVLAELFQGIYYITCIINYVCIIIIIIIAAIFVIVIN
jgi:hypothetical protein